MLNYYKHQYIVAYRTLEIYFGGCSRRCEGCHNQELWERKEEDNKEIQEILDELQEYPLIAQQVHILGGEPLEQDINELEDFLDALKNMGFKNIILFTGNSYDTVKKEFPSVLRHIDYLKVGYYDKNNLNEEHKKQKLFDMELASRNQELIDVNDSGVFLNFLKKVFVS